VGARQQQWLVEEWGSDGGAGGGSCTVAGGEATTCLHLRMGSASTPPALLPTATALLPTALGLSSSNF
jgi:hypothetical protein